ncbi:hypothetical protein AQ490_12410 [Wenjunlia vitaminophila]|uniref:Uncharacterized protein n=1 Tax=Wenjunlia vitaminophila TaxID=76728 RepID=A0A0T6LL00_WENVI|nr:hypothetical protein AQ490_12410 [Wenjunlia vitaminophila]
MAGYLVAVVILVAGGAVFTRNILTFNRGPAVAVAAIVLTGWVVDRVWGRRTGRDEEDRAGLDGREGQDT